MFRLLPAAGTMEHDSEVVEADGRPPTVLAGGGILHDDRAARLDRLPVGRLGLIGPVEYGQDISQHFEDRGALTAVSQVARCASHQLVDDRETLPAGLFGLLQSVQLALEVRGHPGGSRDPEEDLGILATLGQETELELEGVFQELGAERLHLGQILEPFVADPA